MTKPTEPPEAAAAVWAFMQWLTTRPETSGPYSAAHDAVRAFDLVVAFLHTHGLEVPTTKQVEALRMLADHQEAEFGDVLEIVAGPHKGKWGLYDDDEPLGEPLPDEQDVDDDEWEDWGYVLYLDTATPSEMVRKITSSKVVVIPRQFCRPRKADRVVSTNDIIRFISARLDTEDSDEPNADEVVKAMTVAAGQAAGLFGIDSQHMGELLLKSAREITTRIEGSE